MPTPPISLKILKKCVEVYARNNCNAVRAAAQLGLNRDTYRGRLRAAEMRGIKLPTAAEKTMVVGPDKVKILKDQVSNLISQNKILQQSLQLARGVGTPKLTAHKPLSAKIDDEIIVVIPDSHGKFMDMPSVTAFLKDLKALNPHRVIMLGDHLDCNGFLAQHHVWGVVAEAEYTYEDDVACNNWFLDQIQKAAPRAKIDYLEGNHEARVEAWCMTMTLRNGKDADFLRRSIAPEFVLRLKERDIPYYKRSVTYDGLPLAGCIRRGKCHFVHELAGGKDAASTHLKTFGGSVVFGHIHRSVSVISKTVTQGEIGAWSPGCLALQRMYWHHSKLSDHTNGYALQLHSRSGRFLHLNIPIIGGESNLRPLTQHLGAA